MAEWTKNPPKMQEAQKTRVRSLGREDPLEEGTATHSNILAWRIPRTEDPEVTEHTQNYRAEKRREQKEN